MRIVARTRQSLVGVCVVLVAATGFVPASALAPSSANAAVVCVDLVVGAYTVTPAQPVAGEPANISIPVSNQGSCAAQGFVVQFMQSQFATAGPSAAVPGLGAGATTIVNLTYTFPTAGNFLTVAQADPGNFIPETNRKNNLAILSVTVVPATVDLAISSFTINPVEPVQGRVATASITVANLGNSAAGAFRVEWDPRPFATPESVQVNGLAAGGFQVVTFNYTFLATGTFASKAIVDSTNMVHETDETNNTATLTVTVIPPLPDLIVASVTTSANPVAGVAVTATIKVTNQGVSPAGNFLVQWKPAPTAFPITVQVLGLATGASKTLTLSYTYAKAGTYNSTVTVDPTNRVKELDETNNTDSFQVVVQAPFIDLVAVALTASPPNPRQGDPTTITVTVQNQGNIAAGPFLVAWNPDTQGLITPSVQTLSTQVNGLAAGATTTVTFNFSYPQFGNFRTLATVDPFNAVKESNKTNNLILLYLTVSPGNVDVDITGFSVAATYPGATAGSPIIRASEATAAITIKNEGTFPAGNFAIQWRYKSTDTSGPTVFLPGIVPGATQTIMINGAYPSSGAQTSSAVVDPFNQLIEPSEAPVPPADPDGVMTTSVTVQPRVSVVTVTLDSVHVIQNLFDKDSSDWYTKFAVLKSGSTCTFFQSVKPTPVKGLECQSFKIHPDNNSNNAINSAPITVSLVESTPLVALFTGAEINFSCGFLCLSPSISANFVGVSPLILFYPDYLSTGTITVAGIGATAIIGGKGPVCGGHCFDATFTVGVISAPPPLFKAGLLSSVSAARSSITTADGASTTTTPPLPPDMQATYNDFVNTTQALIAQANTIPLADWNDF